MWRCSVIHIGVSSEGRASGMQVVTRPPDTNSDANAKSADPGLKISSIKRSKRWKPLFLLITCNTKSVIL